MRSEAAYGNNGEDVRITLLGPPKFSYRTRQRLAREFMEPFQPWIQSILGVEYQHTVMLEFEFSLASIAVSKAIGQKRPALGRRIDAELDRLVTRVKFPPMFPPSVGLYRRRSDELPLADRTMDWYACWQDSPFAVFLKEFSSPIIVMRFPNSSGAQMPSQWGEMILVSKNIVPELLRMMSGIADRAKVSRIHTSFGTYEDVEECRWEDLILNEEARLMIQNDFETFLARESWFRNKKLSFRRGYLLHGPPGNGKTSVIRTMLSTSGLPGLCINLCSPEIDDDTLALLFCGAAHSGPSVVILEDIDRSLATDSPNRTSVSMPALLNSLDGITSRDGVVVIATANDPRNLDPAILRRPGRFDRVVAFLNPDENLRTRYFGKLSTTLSTGSLQRISAESAGLSFAQLKEVYVLAGQQAFNRGDSEISAADILTALTLLRHSMEESLDPSNGVGFARKLSASSPMETR